MKFLLLLSAICLQLVAIWANAQNVKPDYSSFKVISTVPRTQGQLGFVRQLGRRFSSIDFWKSPLRINEPAEILISSSEYRSLQRILRKAGLETHEKITNVQQFLDKKQNQIETRDLKSGKVVFDLQNFHSYPEIVSYVNDVANSTALAKVSVIGQTLENRDIVMLTLSTGSSTPNKSAIYLECGMHAREWISPATCLWIINDLVSQYGSDSEVTSLLDSYDWLITPVSNPDGYVYSWTTDRLWRKNRAPNAGSSCVGVDTNRNFDANFGGVGSSTEPCSSTYGGPAAFSEAESRAMRDVLAANRPRVKACVSIHSNAQMMLSPYGFNSTLPPDYPEMERVMAITTAAIASQYGTQFEYGNGADVLYLTSGTTKDYVYLTEGIIHGYTLELRNSNDGFVPAPSEIFPTATETWHGLKAMATAILQSVH